MAMTTTKLCSACAVVKPLGEFYRHKSGIHGRLHICKSCHKEKMRIRYATNPAVREYDKARNRTPHRRATVRASGARFRQKHPDKLLAKLRENRREHPDQYQARNALNNALRDGKIFKKPCKCGETKVHAHHEDYSKPLDVIWMCVLCHADLHVRKRNHADGVI